MKKIIFIAVFILSSLFSIGKDHVTIIKLKFSPVQDTIISGTETVMNVITEYNRQKLVLDASNCIVKVKDLKKGIYTITATSDCVGKNAIIKISVQDKKGNLTKVLTKEIPVVSLTQNLKNRYFNKK